MLMWYRSLPVSIVSPSFCDELPAGATGTATATGSKVAVWLRTANALNLPTQLYDSLQGLASRQTSSSLL